MTKDALIIGAGPGIGLATAREFGRNGFRPVLVARDPARLAAMAAELRTDGIEADTIAADAGSVTGLTSAVKGIGADLEVVVYNVGVIRVASIEQQDAASLASDINLDISGALVALKAALPVFEARGGGSFFTTGGGIAFQPSSALLTLSLGKIAIRHLAELLFKPMADKGIHIGTVTVGKGIAPNSPEAADVGRLFHELHAEPKGAWTWEKVYA